MCASHGTAFTFGVINSLHKVTTLALSQEISMVVKPIYIHEKFMSQRYLPEAKYHKNSSILVVFVYTDTYSLLTFICFCRLSK